jgi:glutaredoxin
MNYNCTSSTCYPPFRTDFDRAMQALSSNTCLPSGKLVCNNMGQLVMVGNSGVAEGFRQFSRHKRPMRRMRRRRVKERYHGNGNGNGNGNGKKVTILLMKGCGFCVKLKKEMKQIKQALESKGVKVEVYDQSEDPAAFKAKSKELGATGFPHAEVTSASGKKGEVPGYKPATEYVAKCMALV